MRILQLTVLFQALGLIYKRISYMRIIRIFLYFIGFLVCRYTPYIITRKVYLSTLTNLYTFLTQLLFSSSSSLTSISIINSIRSPLFRYLATIISYVLRNITTLNFLTSYSLVSALTTSLLVLLLIQIIRVLAFLLFNTLDILPIILPVSAIINVPLGLILLNPIPVRLQLAIYAQLLLPPYIFPPQYYSSTIFLNLYTSLSYQSTSIINSFIY